MLFVILFFIINLVVNFSLTSWFINDLEIKIFLEVLSLLIFITSIICITILLIRHYIITVNISLVYLTGLNLISMINLICLEGISFGVIQLWFRAIIFITVVIIGLVIVWKVKTKFPVKFNIYLIFSLITVIINFGGFYNSIYSINFQYDLGGFKIDQSMSDERVVMPKDFIYYSADAFFGTDLSDVSLKYIDPNVFLDENNVASYHLDKYDGANVNIEILKITSMIESILFLVYISIIVLNAKEQGRSEDH